MAIRLGMFTLDRGGSRLVGALSAVVDALLPQVPITRLCPHSWNTDPGLHGQRRPRDLCSRTREYSWRASSPELLAKKFLAVASRPADWRDRGECVQLKNDALLPRRDLSGMPGGAAESPWRPT